MTLRKPETEKISKHQFTKVALFGIVFVSLFYFFSLSFVSSLQDDGGLNINFNYPVSTSVNYSLVNVSSADLWDNLDTPSDISGSEFWYNHTLITQTWINAQGFLTSITNLFDQSLNTTNNVIFKTLFLSTNLTINETLITQNGTTFMTSNDGYLFLDGVTGTKGEIADDPTIQPSGDGLTISVWINSSDCGLYRIIGKWDGASTGTDDGLIVLDTYDGTTDGCGIRMVGANDADQIKVTSNSGDVLTANVWYHVAGVFNGSDLVTYLNGVKQTSVVFGQNTYPDSAFNWGIGEDDEQGGSAEYFKGQIDELMIFNSSLNASDLLWIYNRGRNNGTYEGNESDKLMGHWRFNLGTFNDDIGSNDGTLEGNAVINTETYINARGLDIHSNLQVEDFKANDVDADSGTITALASSSVTSDNIYTDIINSQTGTTLVIDDLYVLGKLTAEGGLDPPYMDYTGNTRRAIYEEAQKWACDGVQHFTEFYNTDTQKKEIYYVHRGEFRDAVTYDLLYTLPDRLVNTDCVTISITKDGETTQKEYPRNEAKLLCKQEGVVCELI